MAVTGKEYEKMAQKAAPPSHMVKNFLMAYLTGGLICTFGELLFTLYSYWGASEKDARMAVSVTLIFITAFLTGIGVFDKIARHAGAGTIVPITGFANSVASPALEFKSEGKIMGTGVQMFSIAGPVIVYGTAAAVVYGLIVWIFRLY